MESIKLLVAKNIATLRTANGMTQSDLAEKLNYSDKSISKWERGESLPDIVVLKELADLFSVTLDALVSKPCPSKPSAPPSCGLDPHQQRRNRSIITGMSILSVWLVSTLLFVVIHSLSGAAGSDWLAFLYAIPASMVVWLVFNTLWFDPRRNFLIISLLMWSALACVHLSLLCLCGYNVWLVFVLGIPGQCIILFWSRLKFKG